MAPSDSTGAAAAGCGGDARKLIAALANNEVPRWRSNKTDALRDYLEEHGYLDAREPLTKQVIHQKVVAKVLEDLEVERITPEWIDVLVASLPVEMPRR